MSAEWVPGIKAEVGQLRGALAELADALKEQLAEVRRQVAGGQRNAQGAREDLPRVVSGSDPDGTALRRLDEHERALFIAARRLKGIDGLLRTVEARIVGLEARQEELAEAVADN
jgi:hypothetical protein